MRTAHGYAALSSSTPLVPHAFSRRDLRPNDVRSDMLFCGFCQSDIHTVHGAPAARVAARRHEAIN
jgi:uncharacterized zinc-type alcohol dehydrogenase-like protein